LLRCDEQLHKWHVTYSPSLKVSYQTLTRGHIDNHLAPHFADRDMRDIGEEDLLDFIRVKLEAGMSPKTLRNVLGTLRRVYSLLHARELVPRNPAINIGALLTQVGRSVASETDEVEHWTRSEVTELISIAHEHEPRFAPVLTVLMSTGMRRGEALGLKWSDVDFDSRRLRVRRAVTESGITTPKNGKSRRVMMTESLADTLFELLSDRQKEALAKGWPTAPDWVFCSEVGSAPNPRNVARVWERVRRRAQKKGVRPLKLHCARHTWATFALEAGKSIRWVADQLGHADPARTLRVYAHAMLDEETDLSFAEFGDPKRPYTAPTDSERIPGTGKYLNSMARREGFEPPTLRFEA
jgi:integrase